MEPCSLSPCSAWLHIRFTRSQSTDDSAQEESVPAMDPLQLREQLELSSPADVLRRTFLGPKSLQRNRSILNRLEKNQNRPGDWKETIQRENVFKRLRHFESAPEAAVVVSLDLLRFQYRGCSMPEDYTLVYTGAFKYEESARLIASRSMQTMLMSCLKSLAERSRPNYDGADTPERVLIAIDLFVRQAQSQGFEVERSVILLGLKNAAGCLSLTGLKRYLGLWQQHETKTIASSVKPIDLSFFTDIVSSLRSPREMMTFGSAEQQQRGVLEILCGFEDAPDNEPYHLGAHLPRDSIDAMSHWLALLAHWKGVDQIWAEWLQYQMSDAADRGKWSPGSKRHQNFHEDIVRLFILNMFRAGGIKGAWRMFEASSEFILQSDEKLWGLLFQNADSMPRLKHDLHERVKARFVSKLERFINTLEVNLGIEWIGSHNGQEPYHKPISHATDKLNQLSEKLSTSETRHLKGISKKTHPRSHRATQQLSNTEHAETRSL